MNTIKMQTNSGMKWDNCSRHKSENGISKENPNGSKTGNEKFRS